MSKNLESIKETVFLCADRGWRLSMTLTNEDNEEEDVKGVFITAVDEDQKAIVVERAGERHIPPRIVFLSQIKAAEAIWSKD